jgi:hypothetical protein
MKPDWRKAREGLEQILTFRYMDCGMSLEDAEVAARHKAARVVERRMNQHAAAVTSYRASNPDASERDASMAVASMERIVDSANEGWRAAERVLQKQDRTLRMPRVKLAESGGNKVE